MFTLGGDYSAAPKVKPMCGCTDTATTTCAASSSSKQLKTIPDVMQELDWTTPNGCAHLPARR